MGWDLGWGYPSLTVEAVGAPALVVRQPPATLLLRHEGLAGSVDVAGLRILELQPRQSDLVRRRCRARAKVRVTVTVKFTVRDSVKITLGLGPGPWPGLGLVLGLGLVYGLG